MASVFIMQITVLVDNNTLIDRYFLAEPGLSLLIEDATTRVLFDTGYSGIFLENAAAMGKDLSALDYLVLSHKHLDHTWGLETLIRHFTQLDLEGRRVQRPVLMTHPDVFNSVSGGGLRELGCLLSQQKCAAHFPLHLSTEPQKLNSRLIFLGQIPRKNDFEAGLTFGEKHCTQEPDTVPDDSALVYQTSKGLVIISGCAHAGICNIIEYAKTICGDHRVLDIVGGLHLQNPPESQLKGTLDYLETLRPENIHACHCTDLPSKIALSSVAKLKEVGVGLSISYTDLKSFRTPGRAEQYPGCL